jgi:hypothetical protein
MPHVSGFLLQPITDEEEEELHNVTGQVWSNGYAATTPVHTRTAADHITE